LEERSSPTGDKQKKSENRRKISAKKKPKDGLFGVAKASNERKNSRGFKKTPGKYWELAIEVQERTVSSSRKDP